MLPVSDTGVGLTSQDLARVFDRFYRAGGARQSVEDGSGLGLAIVKTIAELHGGQVRAESVANGGSAFVFSTSKGGHPAAKEPSVRISPQNIVGCPLNLLPCNRIVKSTAGG